MQTSDAVHAARAIGGAVFVLVSIGATPLHAQQLACAAGSPATDPSANTFLGKLTTGLQTPWSDNAKNIDPLSPSPDGIGSGDQVSACSSNAGTACFIHTGLTNCEHVTTDYNVSDYTGLANTTITNISVGAFNPKDVATHSAWGPDAAKVSDGVFAPEGETWNSPYFTVVLPSAGASSAVTIDLGSSLTICGTSACGPYVQADRHNMELDWWDETGQVWKAWGGTCESSGSGLILRPVIPSTTPGSVKCGSANTTGANFTTRYVRVWALPGADDNDFSVAEIQLRDGSSGNISNAAIVSTGKVAIGPRPYLINDGFAPKDGTAWNDTTYAVVLRDSGPGNALAIDLGGPVALCVSSGCVSVQADKNVYQVDYSLDGSSWVPYGQLPAASSTGLRTRSVTPTSATAGKGVNGVTARYVRIWGCDPSQCEGSGDTNFSVSEMVLLNTASPGVNVAAAGNTTFGPSAFGPERVATNGLPPVDSANLDWDDPRFTIIMAPCLSNAAQKCAQLGTAPPTTGPLFVDLTGTFPISGMAFQGDRHQFQVDYYDTSAGAWKSLWTVPSTSSSGLSTRTMPPPATPPQARYLMVYGTAGDDNNYSVSSLQVITKTANTSCGYNSAANYGQAFGCSYDASLLTQVGPSSGVTINFTIASASSHLRCTNGTTSSNWTAINYPDGTTCQATLLPVNTVDGGYCSGACSSGAYVATLASLNPPPPPGLTTPAFVLADLACSSAPQKQDSNITDGEVQQFTNGLAEFVSSVAAGAVQQLFNGLVAGSIPDGKCAAKLDTPNTTVDGKATQVGSNDDNGHVRMSGEAAVPAAMRLDQAAFTLDQALFENGGVEELVRTDRRGGLTPLHLELRPGSKATRAVYATAAGRVPSVRATLSRNKSGSVAFDIQINHARMPTLPQCTGASPSAELATRFTLEDAGNSITVRARQPWACKGKQLSTL